MSDSKPDFRLGGEDLSSRGMATATCFCGTVRLAFPTTAPGLLADLSFVCHCDDCHKITASAFATNFIAREDAVEHLRGKDKMTQFAQSKTIASHKLMTNHFCSVCGTLLYRIGEGFPGMLIMRVGTVDDFNLQETLLKPRIEQFTKDRLAWLDGVDGTKKAEAMAKF